ncbi:hypothetical protein DFH08DRAFT_803234 [Mycena albidolilacea]|uniref:Uncharacterized protein n=1 Tax=Mycena albidolilacea TaxID=1033008 RepID=A0AAD7EYQ7_9AGAR|nr:hypothetical protein DFH08DRAFT_803234 [Mycena albidolilacea]
MPSNAVVTTRSTTCGASPLITSIDDHRKKTRERMAHLRAAPTEEQREKHQEAQRKYRERYAAVTHSKRWVVMTQARYPVKKNAARGKVTKLRPKARQYWSDPELVTLDEEDGEEGEDRWHSIVGWPPPPSMPIRARSDKIPPPKLPTLRSPIPILRSPIVEKGLIVALGGVGAPDCHATPEANTVNNGRSGSPRSLLCKLIFYFSFPVCSEWKGIKKVPLDKVALHLQNPLFVLLELDWWTSGTQQNERTFVRVCADKGPHY